MSRSRGVGLTDVKWLCSAVNRRWQEKSLALRTGLALVARQSVSRPDRALQMAGSPGPCPALVSEGRSLSLRCAPRARTCLADGKCGPAIDYAKVGAESAATRSNPIPPRCVLATAPRCPF
jgi:hypothetical protein